MCPLPICVLTSLTPIKAISPLDNEMTDVSLLVCGCIATERGFQQRGPRSLLGCVLPARNHPYLNAGPRTWVAFCADNGDIKFPHRFPILKETHELLETHSESCGSMSDNVHMIYDLQAALAAAAGYFLEVTRPRCKIKGHKDLARIRESLMRKVEVQPRFLQHKEFAMYSKRLVKDLEAKGICRTSVERLNLQLH